jgi:hypothetical protein
MLEEGVAEKASNKQEIAAYFDADTESTAFQRSETVGEMTCVGIGTVVTAAAAVKSMSGKPPAKSQPKTVTIDKSKYPAAARHLEDAGAVGKPLTIDRAGADSRRSAALKGVPTKPAMDRDEAPPAVVKEGSKSVRHIPSGDNRGAGGSLGQQIKDINDGEQIIIQTTDQSRLLR